ncbi:MAG: hypothetical protein ACI814_004830 [Mariniblastus sp.]|jgi:hypothetical protein
MAQSERRSAPPWIGTSIILQLNFWLLNQRNVASMIKPRNQNEYPGATLPTPHLARKFTTR